MVLDALLGSISGIILTLIGLYLFYSKELLVMISVLLNVIREC